MIISFQFTILLTLLYTAVLPTFVLGQFEFFEQFFRNTHSGPNSKSSQDKSKSSSSNNMPQSSWYQDVYSRVKCNAYVCPDTLECVNSPEECPCQFPHLEDRTVFDATASSVGSELAHAVVCASKGGSVVGETLKKVELARKGLL